MFKVERTWYGKARFMAPLFSHFSHFVLESYLSRENIHLGLKFVKTNVKSINFQKMDDMKGAEGHQIRFLPLFLKI